MKGGPKEHTELQEIEEVLVDVQEPYHLIVWNDEVNTFEWVIETYHPFQGKIRR
jgi:ATP-dependent Clp protease adaptor protein ClpS